MTPQPSPSARLPPPSIPRYLTPGEVAALFRVDPKTVTRWGNTGRLPSVKTPGGHRRYPEAAVLEILEQGRSS